MLVAAWRQHLRGSYPRWSRWSVHISFLREYCEKELRASDDLLTASTTQSKTYDKDVHEHLCSDLRHGFVKAMENTLRLKELGLLFAGLPCHSFIWLNLATSLRSATRPFGDNVKLCVRQSNACLTQHEYIIIIRVTCPDVRMIIYVCDLYYVQVHICIFCFDPCSWSQVGNKTFDLVCHRMCARSALRNRTARKFYLCAFPLSEMDHQSASWIRASGHPPVALISENELSWPLTST